GAAEGALDTELSAALPRVVAVGEENRVGAGLFDDALDGLGLLVGAGNGRVVVARRRVRPASLQVEHVGQVGVVGAHLLGQLELVQDEVTRLLGNTVGVEEGLRVDTDHVNGLAEVLVGLLLQHVESLGGSELLDGKTGLGDRGPDGHDELAELGGGAPLVEDGLVTHDNQLDKLPVAALRTPLGELGDLLLGLLDSVLVNVDADDHLQVVLLASGTNVDETVAVGGVHTDGGETLVLDGLDVLHDVVGLLALAVGAVGSVGDGPLVAVGGHAVGVLAAGVSRAGGGRRRRSRSRASRRDGGHGGALSGGGGAGLALDVTGRGGGGGGGGGSALGAVGTDKDIVGLGDGDGLLRVSVGTRGVRGGRGVDGDRGLGDAGGGGSNGVLASGRAGVGRGLDHAGGRGVGGLHGGVRASHSGRGDDRGRDTTVSVDTRSKAGSRGGTDGGAVGESDSLGRDGVSTGGRVRRHSRGGHGLLVGRGARGRGSRSQGSRRGSGRQGRRRRVGGD
ncbi:uncharacterized protein K452DRAFT_336865, partial [Aplosporella prunicola CBS 121167]